MTGTSGVRAVCEGCGAAYRVPSAERAYACKKCGGAVRAEDGDARADDALGRACPACHAVLPATSRFCPECGAEWRAEGARPASRRSLTERRLAAHDLGRARRAIRAVRAVFWTYGALSFLSVLGSLAFLRVADDDQVGPVLVLLGMCTLLCLLSLAGLNLAARHPFPCAVALASFASLVVALVALQGEIHLIPLGLAAASWAAVVPTARARRLLREHSDLYVARRLMGAHPAEAIEGAQAMRDHGRRAWLRLGAQATGLLLLVGLATLGVWRKRTPLSPSLADAGVELEEQLALQAELARFHKAWNRGTPEDIVALQSRWITLSDATRIPMTLARRGWHVERPALQVAGIDGAELDETGMLADRTFRFESLDAELVTRWKRIGRSWHLDSLTLPPTSLEDDLRAFASAWPRAERLAAFYSEPLRESGRASLERILAERGWTAEAPPLGAFELGATHANTREVRFAVGGERMRTLWSFPTGADCWYLTVLEPPDE